MNKQIKQPKIIIYDDENLNYIVGNAGMFDMSSEPECISSPFDAAMRFIPSLTANFNCTIPNYKILNTIELDETLMKRIAKYNKEVYIKKLDKKIKEKQEKINELDSILNDREKRVKKLKEFIKNIYDIDVDNDDELEDWD